MLLIRWEKSVSVKKIDGKRSLFTLKEVKLGGHTIFSDKTQMLDTANSLTFLSIPGSSDYPEDVFHLRLTLETPLRMKFENRLKADLPFHVLVRAMLRRISSLFNTYANGEPPLGYRGLVKRAKDIRIVDSSLDWFDWKRYSFRQDKSMLMGGMIGSVAYEGKLGEFMLLIDFCAQAHLGKQTSFGLGKIKWEIIS